MTGLALCLSGHRRRLPRGSRRRRCWRDCCWGHRGRSNRRVPRSPGKTREVLPSFDRVHSDHRQRHVSGVGASRLGYKRPYGRHAFTAAGCADEHDRPRLTARDDQSPTINAVHGHADQTGPGTHRHPGHRTGRPDRHAGVTRRDDQRDTEREHAHHAQSRPHPPTDRRRLQASRRSVRPIRNAHAGPISDAGHRAGTLQPAIHAVGRPIQRRAIRR